MAATKRNAMLIEEMRKLIDTKRLVNRLQNHVFGKVKLEKTQITAASILLRKTLPDLVATELSGPQGEPIKFLDMSAPEQGRQLAAALAKLVHRSGATA